MVFSQYLHSFCGHRVAVIGVGVSNRPLLKLLVDAGADVTICDRKTATELGSIVEDFSALGVQFRLGAGYLEGLDHDVIFRTPGLRPDAPGVAEAVARGSILTSEMEGFFEVCPCPIIAVTGSEGKTTTTTIIAELLRRAGRTVHIGGNIGWPLLDKVPQMTPSDIAVVELSSFQLMTMRRSAGIAVVKNVTPNHLDYHRGMQEYIDAKRNVFRYQDAFGVVILNRDNEVTRAFADEAKGEVRWFSIRERVENGAYLEGDTIYLAQNGDAEPVLNRADIRLAGRHNAENFATAIATIGSLVPHEEIVAFAQEFAGVEHRMEFVREFEGVRYFNDSIATAPTRVIAGLHAFDQKMILIAGGYDKKIPFDALGPEFVAHLKALVLCGATAPLIRAVVVGAPGYDPALLPIVETDDFRDAVFLARGFAGPGDIIALSPACAAFDKFQNFEHRGWVFKEIVQGF